MKVYVVITGFYDELQAVFDNEELAEKIASCISGATVTEWQLNDISNAYVPYYYIEMEKDGELLCASRQDHKAVSCESILSVNDDALIGYVLAKDEEQAIKIANEKRLQLIANNEWK